MPRNIEMNNVTNCSILLGNMSLVGTASEVKLPTVKWKKVDHKSLGMIGTPQLPAGVEPLEMSIKWNGPYKAVLSRIGNPFTAQKYVIQSAVDSYDGNTGLSRRIEQVHYVTAMTTDIPQGDFAAHEKVETEVMYTVTHVRHELDGEVMLEIDVINNIYIVNGVDVLADWRQIMQ